MTSVSRTLAKLCFLAVAALLGTALTIPTAGPSIAADAGVSLGAATSFGVLGGSTVTNTGPSAVTGDVGVSPGVAVIGFPPGRIAPPFDVHQADPVATAAHAAAVAAYADAVGRSPGSGNTGLTDLVGLTFGPGVYSGTALALTGNVFLDAHNDPSAVFIFQSASTLTLAADSSVSLVNGARACEVFWQVGSSATLGIDSSLVGSVLAAASVTATTGASVDGRLLAVNGAVTLDTNGISPSTCQPDEPLNLSNGPPPDGRLGQTYTDQLAAGGGAAPLTFSITSGALPAGITLAADTGLLSGSPTVAGTFSFTVGVVDTVGATASQALSMTIAPVPVVHLVASVASTTATGSVTLTATVDPLTATGTVTFTDVTSSGTTALGSNSIGSDGVAAIAVTLSQLGAHSITASYVYDRTSGAATATPVVVQVNSTIGDLIIKEFRQSGPGGAADAYVELFNASASGVDLAGFELVAASGPVVTLPGSSPTLPAGRSFLVTGADYSLGSNGHSDATADLGSGGIRVIAPDTGGTVTDAVGPDTSGYFSGSPLPRLSGTPTDQYGWVRIQTTGHPKNTSSNSVDFALMSTTGRLVGQVQSMVGSPSPTGSTDPYQQTSTLKSTLLDPSQRVSQPPNRVVVNATGGGPTSLTVRRVITNNSPNRITAMKLRLISLSEVNGVSQSGLPGLGAANAELRAVPPATTTSEILLGTTPVTVQNVSPDAPTGSSGGLNTTYSVPLGAGLAPGATVAVAFTFAADSHGAFWFVYDVDAN